MKDERKKTNKKTNKPKKKKEQVKTWTFSRGETKIFNSLSGLFPYFVIAHSKYLWLPCNPNLHENCTMSDRLSDCEKQNKDAEYSHKVVN